MAMCGGRARIAVAFLLGFVFLAAGVAKASDIASARNAMDLVAALILGDAAPSRSALDGLAALLVAGEVSLGLSLMIFGSRCVFPSLLSAGLLAAFSIILFILLVTPGAPSCGCFGGWKALRADAQSSAIFGIIRNAGLFVASLWLAAGGISRASTMPREKTNTRKGFTLIEIIIVIAVVGVLIAITVPALRGAKRTAKDVESLRAIGQSVAAVAVYSRLSDDYLPYLGVPGRPERGTMPGSMWSWNPPRYFWGQTKYWPTALDRHGIDLSGIREITRLNGPPRIRSFFFMTHAAHARPEYWVGPEIPDDERLYAGVRLGEAVFPSGKGLLLDVDFRDHVSSDGAPHPSVPWNIGFFDGSARTEWSDWDLDRLTDLERPYGAIPWRVLTTHEGVRGIDFPRP